MSGVAVVFGLCALSFAAGCVLTAVMLRRDQPPEPAPEPVPAAPPPGLEPPFPPGDYATKPIHRNPVMGLPSALPAPRPTRPNLVLVPDPPPATELPVRQHAARRMHVVPDDRALAGKGTGVGRETGIESVTGVEESAEPTGGPDAAGPVAAVVEPASVDVEHAEAAERLESVEGAEAVDGVEGAAAVEPPAEPGAERAVASEEPAEPVVIPVPAHSEQVPVQRTFEAARRESNR